MAPLLMVQLMTSRMQLGSKTMGPAGAGAAAGAGAGDVAGDVGATQPRWRLLPMLQQVQRLLLLCLLQPRPLLRCSKRQQQRWIRASLR